MTWNYYQYNIVTLEDGVYTHVVSDWGEDLAKAREEIKVLRQEFPNEKFYIQQIHSVARIVH